MRRLAARSAMVVGLLGVLGALALALWPIDANGVSGNAIRPHYGQFGWEAYAPFPENHTVTLDELRAAGVRVPQDVVSDRRHYAEAAAGLGIIGLLCALAMRSRARPSEPAISQ